VNLKDGKDKNGMIGASGVPIVELEKSRESGR